MDVTRTPWTFQNTNSQDEFWEAFSLVDSDDYASLMQQGGCVVNE